MSIHFEIKIGVNISNLHEWIGYVAKKINRGECADSGLNSTKPKTAVAATSNGQLQVIDHLDIDVYDFYCSGISFSNKES